MMKVNCISGRLARRCNLLGFNFLTRQVGPCINIILYRRNNNSSKKSHSSPFQPLEVRPETNNVGQELSGTLDKPAILKQLNRFMAIQEVKTLAKQYALDDNLLEQTFKNFRNYCLNSDSLPADLHIVLSDVLQGARHVTDIFPYFLRHAKSMFPHIECLEDLKKISDLRTPPNWYPIARAKQRKIIFHAGPTNSGKTYHALERLMKSKSGVYCGPLKLLVSEVFKKCNEKGTPCDLVTGEERRFASPTQEPAKHISCTVEMVDLNNCCEVAVIDEIQLIRDMDRGWAWTRALLGIPADEVHLCGEAAAINLVTELCTTMGENVEIQKYDRLTVLEVEKKALVSLDRVCPGDCIVCFNKNDIFTVSRKIEEIGKEVAIIYGSLPPGAKLSQAAKFNDPNHPCKILVATNAIGMGLNLHIKRIIFYSLMQPTVNEKGEKGLDTITVSSALQIAGRAGRYGTQWEKGYVTTYKAEDLPILQKLLQQTPEVISKAGLHPTADQIELYAFHLPKISLSNLMDIFVALCTVDNSLYFMCNIDDFKYLANMIDCTPLPLRARFIFCCAPINRKMPFVCAMFVKFARQFSKNEIVSFTWLHKHIGWPFEIPVNISELAHMESIFDVLDLYLWLSYRFTYMFPDETLVREAQKILDSVIEQGIIKLARSGSRCPDTKYNSEFDPKTERRGVYKNGSFSPKFRTEGKTIMKGRLTEKLITEGLLTPKLIQRLQQEWSQEKNSHNNSMEKQRTRLDRYK